MPIIQPDTSAVKELGPIEPGTYPAKIAACDAKTSKSGNPMIVPAFEIEVGDGDVRTRNAYVVISGAGAYGFDSLLRATGFDEIADQYRNPDAEKPAFNTDDLVGQELMVVVSENLYNGQKRDQITGYLRK
jgi:hypothetical protein